MRELKTIAPEDYLMHFGVEGQKWGIRRYQNPDGSLTDAGRKHYGYTGKRYGDRVRKNKALGMNQKQAELEAFKVTNRTSKAAQGVRTYIAANNALVGAGSIASAAVGSFAGFPPAMTAFAITEPLVIAAAAGGYSIYRHYKNKKFHEGILNNATDKGSPQKNSN